MKKKFHCAVIGSGIGGIGSAIRLAAKGYDVTVFEQAKMPGGKISQIHKQGFRFDTGPSLFTLPHLVDELFGIMGENPEQHFSYHKLDLSCKYFWDDGTIINAWQNTNKFANEVENATGVPAKKIYDFLDKSKRLYENMADVFIFNSIHKLSNLTKPEYKKSLLHLHELDAFTTMHKRNKKRFSDPKIVQLFDRYATYNGSSPYKTPATLNIISHLEHNIGAFFPEKGIYSIVSSLTKMAERHGIKFVYDTPVEEIVMDNKQVKSLKVDNNLIPFDCVVSNMDVDNFYPKLLPKVKRKYNKLIPQRSSSALIFYWGINREFPELKTHNIIFSENYRNEFKHLFESKDVSSDLTIYIFISSKEIKSDAPDGMENWYVMINVPENIGQDWDALINKTRKTIISKINNVLKTDIEKHILFEEKADPRSIETNTFSFRGSLYGPSSNSILAAFLRHPNFNRKYKNLYFTGGSVHPGGGIPLCLASAKIIEQIIKPVNSSDKTKT